MSRSQSPPPPTKPLPNKWSIAVAASLVHALHATAVYMGPATLLSPMRASLNLSVAQVTLPLNVYRAVQAVFLIPAGLILDIVGPQLSLRIAITAAALMAPLLPLVNTLPQLIFLQAFFSVTKLFGGLSALLLITAAAFSGSHGIATATSILLSGYSFAGFLAPAVIGSLSQRFGWRIAFSFLSALFILIALPLTFHFLREQPNSNTRNTNLWKAFKRAFLSLLPSSSSSNSSSQQLIHHPAERRPLTDNPQSPSLSPLQQQQQQNPRPNRPSSADSIKYPPKTPISSSSSSSKLSSSNYPNPTNTTTASLKPISQGFEAGPLESLPISSPPDKEQVFTAPFLLIATAVAAFSFSMNIVFDHLLVFLNEDFGLPFTTATFYMSAFNLIALFSKLFVGPIADRVNKALLIALFSTIGVFASCLLLDFSAFTFTVTTNITKIIGFVVMYGIAYAAVFSLTTSILPEFGNSKLGVRSNFNLMLLYSAGSLGSLASGYLRSNLGSYKWPFLLNVVSFAITAIAGLIKYFAYDVKVSAKAITTERRIEKTS